METDGVTWSVCLCVGHLHEPCKNRWTDRDAVLGDNSRGSKKQRIKWVHRTNPFASARGDKSTMRPFANNFLPWPWIMTWLWNLTYIRSRCTHMPISRSKVILTRTNTQQLTNCYTWTTNCSRQNKLNNFLHQWSRPTCCSSDKRQCNT